VTAHYALGARTAAATASAGALFLLLGLALGDSLPILLRTVAPGALAGMLIFVAIQHAFLAARLEHRSELAIAWSVGIVTLAAGNLAIGFGVGAVAWAAWRWWSSRGLALPAGLGNK
jgi:hypothetical protein